MFSSHIWSYSQYYIFRLKSVSSVFQSVVCTQLLSNVIILSSKKSLTRVLLNTKDIPDCNAEGHPFVANGSLPLYNTR